MDPVEVRLVIVLADVLIRGLLVICEARAPRHLADLAIIQLLVVLHHVFVNLCALPIDLLVLLIEFIVIGLPLVVEFVNCFFVVPILISLEVATTSLWAKIILSVHAATAVLLAIETVDI